MLRKTLQVSSGYYNIKFLSSQSRAFSLGKCFPEPVNISILHPVFCELKWKWILVTQKESTEDGVGFVSVLTSDRQDGRLWVKYRKYHLNSVTLFTVRVVSHWNKLSNNVEMFLSLKLFEKWLEKALSTWTWLTWPWFEGLNDLQKFFWTLTVLWYSSIITLKLQKEYLFEET